MLGVSQSFFGSMQIEFLDRRTWHTRAELAHAIFEWIEAWYNPVVDIPPWATAPRSSTKPFTRAHPSGMITTRTVRKSQDRSGGCCQGDESRRICETIAWALPAESGASQLRIHIAIRS